VRVEDYAPMTHSIAGFEHPMLDRSVGSGAASDSAARVWCRAPKPGPYCVVYYSVQRPSRRRVVKFDARKGASDLVSVVELREGISPGERYGYWIEAADRDERVGDGRFETALARDTQASAGAVEERARRGFGGFLHILGVESAFFERPGPRVVLSWLSMKLFGQIDGEIKPVYSGAAL
jgi:hypothetical protein